MTDQKFNNIPKNLSNHQGQWGKCYTIENESDRNYLFPNEIEALHEFKKDPIASKMADKVLLVFLFGRHMDIPESKKLLLRHLEWRKINGYENAIEWKEVRNSFQETNFFLQKIGARDRMGRGIMYFLPKNFFNRNSEKPSSTHIKQFIWQWEHTIIKESLDYFRKGATFVFPVDNLSIFNIDFWTAKNVVKDMTDRFPTRVSFILVVNPGVLFNTILKIAPKIIKSRLIERVKEINRADIQNFIEPSQLIVEYGGQLQFDQQKWFQEIDDEQG